jgi:S-adenosylmethionine hydrolase
MDFFMPETIRRPVERCNGVPPGEHRPQPDQGRGQLAALLLATALALLIATSPALARPIVVFLSDFGAESEAPALCHGAILSIDPEIEVVDLTHAVRPYDIRQGAEILGRATTFPRGTVFFGVVDPGVGTKRRAVAIRTNDGCFFVGPDNGLLTEVIRTRGVAAAVEVKPLRVNPRWKPGTFDGRDLFAPTAALLAETQDLARVGTACDAAGLVLLPPTTGGIIGTDGSIAGTYTVTDEPYGNIWTDIDRATVAKAGLRVGGAPKPGVKSETDASSAAGTAPANPLGTVLEVEIGPARFTAPLVTTFGDVPEGQALAYFDSEERLAFALNMGSLRDSLRVPEGSRVVVRKAGR